MEWNIPWVSPAQLSHPCSFGNTCPPKPMIWRRLQTRLMRGEHCDRDRRTEKHLLLSRTVQQSSTALGKWIKDVDEANRSHTKCKQDASSARLTKQKLCKTIILPLLKSGDRRTAPRKDTGCFEDRTQRTIEGCDKDCNYVK